MEAFANQLVSNSVSFIPIYIFSIARSSLQVLCIALIWSKHEYASIASNKLTLTDFNKLESIPERFLVICSNCCCQFDCPCC
jgi:hypothetical protein